MQTDDEQPGHAGVCAACQPAVNRLMGDARKSFRDRNLTAIESAAKTAATSTAMALVGMSVTGVLPLPPVEPSKPLTPDEFNSLSAAYGREAAQQAVKARAEWLVQNDKHIKGAVERHARMQAALDAYDTVGGLSERVVKTLAGRRSR